MNKKEFKQDSTYQSLKGNKKWEALGLIGLMSSPTSRYDYGYGFKKFTFKNDINEAEVFLKLFSYCDTKTTDLRTAIPFYKEWFNEPFKGTKKNVKKIKEFFEDADLTGGFSTIVYIKRPDGSFAYKHFAFEELMGEFAEYQVERRTKYE